MAYERKEISIENIRAQEAICERIREILTDRVGQPLAMVDTYGCQQNEATAKSSVATLPRWAAALRRTSFRRISSS